MNTVDQIRELCIAYPGMKHITEGNNNFVRGIFAFKTKAEGKEEIEDFFDLEIKILEDYPKSLPVVRDVGGKVDNNYSHLYGDKTFCLASPLDMHLTFRKNPTLLGFVDDLVVSYLYSYCYFKKFGIMPFDELSHGPAGLIEYYEDIFGVKFSRELWQGIKLILKTGYRGHLPCPCGSGNRVRKCHSQIVRELTSPDILPVLKGEINMIELEISKIRR